MDFFWLQMVNVPSVTGPPLPPLHHLCALSLCLLRASAADPESGWFIFHVNIIKRFLQHVPYQKMIDAKQREELSLCWCSGAPSRLLPGQILTGNSIEYDSVSSRTKEDEVWTMGVRVLLSLRSIDEVAELWSYRSSHVSLRLPADTYLDRFKYMLISTQ